LATFHSSENPVFRFSAVEGCLQMGFGLYQSQSYSPLHLNGSGCSREEISPRVFAGDLFQD
jgi:hypothetical protein